MAPAEVEKRPMQGNVGRLGRRKKKKLKHDFIRWRCRGFLMCRVAGGPCLKHVAAKSHPGVTHMDLCHTCKRTIGLKGTPGGDDRLVLGLNVQARQQDPTSQELQDVPELGSVILAVSTDRLTDPRVSREAYPTVGSLIRPAFSPFLIVPPESHKSKAEEEQKIAAERSEDIAAAAAEAAEAVQSKLEAAAGVEAVAIANGEATENEIEKANAQPYFDTRGITTSSI